MTSSKKLSQAFSIEFDSRLPLETFLTDEELYDIKNEFVWFFNGQNHAKDLFLEKNLKHLDVLYEKYKSEINKMKDYYGLEESIEELENAHDWFLDWKKLEIFNKEQFLEKIKLGQDFSLIWGDLGVTDSLEFRNWGISVQYDSNDNASIKTAGKDQLNNLFNSLLTDPDNNLHCICLFNPSNKEERYVPTNLLMLQFYCKKLTYKERVKWFFENHFNINIDYKDALVKFKKENLDKLQHGNQFIAIPKYQLSSLSSYHKIKNQKELEEVKLFNTLFLQTISKVLNMEPGFIKINSTKFSNDKEKNNKKDKIFIQVVPKFTNKTILESSSFNFSRTQQ